ncbi:MAG: ethanolamine utilization protein EutN [Gemmatimonadetes bacterium]|jgi:ethanolamine utilization protein EutN|nr:ethanolamine utilization protein EutN [Gemmatimonadota bacterium]
MIVGRVKGHVVASAKVENLEGKKMLVVEILSVTPEGLSPTNLHMVCIDAVQAGEGEVVVVVQGSSARIAPGMEKVPVDALIVGIVENLNAFGRDMNDGFLA